MLSQFGSVARKALIFQKFRPKSMRNLHIQMSATRKLLNRRRYNFALLQIAIQDVRICNKKYGWRRKK